MVNSLARLATLAAIATQVTISQADTAEPLWRSQACLPAHSSPEPFDNHPGLDHRSFAVVNWNIQKAANTGWERDLGALAASADLVLLQEAPFELDWKAALHAQPFGTFAPGYVTAGSETGVVTLSSIPVSAHCAQQHLEPWLRTPKATEFSHFRVDNGDMLLVVNLHGVNFALGTADWQTQLGAAIARVDAHTGPVILGGDFNSWSDTRRELLLDLTSSRSLQPVEFREDRRTRVFGNVLDHMYVRGLAVVDSQTYAVSSSDHNPFRVTLAVATPPAPRGGVLASSPP
jgi:endonuclease/exonuclease/phosphatase (EEP) superfamily protein YafD